MLLLKEDDGDNDVAADSDIAAGSDVSSASVTAPFASAPVVDDDEPIFVKLLFEGNLMCLTTR